MTKRIVPTEFKTHLIEQLIESIDEEANTSYYSFVGDHVSTGVTEAEVVQPDASFRTLNIETYRNMIFGKRLTLDDMKLVIQRHDWTNGVVYARYDDEDINLFDKNFYTMVDEGEFKHIYKCLDNANNSPSTAQPVFNDITPDDYYYQSSDGYLWKYMYTINSVEFAKFSTQKYIPVIENKEVSDAAMPGTIDVIKIQTDERFGTLTTLNGKNYNNYLTDVLFTEGDVTVGNTVQYRIPGGSSTVRGFYGNTIIHITSGQGAGQYRKVVDSYLNLGLGGTIIELDRAFDTAPNQTSRYELSPEVRITGNGTETVTAIARAIINANASNSIHRVEMLEVGSNYNYATATVLKGVPASAQNTGIGDLVIPTDASVKPIIPPSGGHGANTASELGAASLCIYTKFQNSEGNTIPTEATFAQFGIIRDPLFANVEVDFVKDSDGTDGSDGTFLSDENVYQIQTLKLDATVSLNVGNTIVECNELDVDLTSYFKVGQFVYITNPATQTENIITSVVQVIDESTFVIDKEPLWGSANCDIYLARVTSRGVINDTASSSKIYVNRVLGKLKQTQLLVGDITGTKARVSRVNINNKLVSPANYDFRLYTQYVKCIGTVSGSFIPNEIVYQGNLSSPSFTARVHSYSDGELRLTQLDGELNTSQQIFGALSNANMFAAFDKYNGDLDPTSGSIIYLQNEVPITRVSNRSEEIRVILEF